MSERQYVEPDCIRLQQEPEYYRQHVQRTFQHASNGDVKLFKALKVGYSAMYTHRKTDLGNDNVFLNGTLINPVTRVYDDDGELAYYPSAYCSGFMQINPHFYTSDKYLENQSFRDRAFFNFYADWTIIDGLNFRTSLTPDLQFVESGAYNSPYMNLMSYTRCHIINRQRSR